MTLLDAFSMNSQQFPRLVHMLMAVLLMLAQCTATNTSDPSDPSSVAAEDGHDDEVGAGSLNIGRVASVAVPILAICCCCICMIGLCKRFMEGAKDYNGNKNSSCYSPG